MWTRIQFSWQRPGIFAWEKKEGDPEDDKSAEDKKNCARAREIQYFRHIAMTTPESVDLKVAIEYGPFGMRHLQDVQRSEGRTDRMK